MHVLESTLLGLQSINYSFGVVSPDLVTINRRLRYRLKRMMKEVLKRMSFRLVVVDFNPSELNWNGCNCIPDVMAILEIILPHRN